MASNNKIIDRQMGEFGEQEVCGQLQRALLGTGVKFSGFEDKGIDLLMQFESPGADRRPLYFCVQVKTGNSFAKSIGSKWRITGIDEGRFEQWKRSQLPVLFVWVRPTNPASCYWTVVRRNTSRTHFLISKKSLITPSIRFDLATECLSDYKTERPSGSIKVLEAPLGVALRPFAKEFHKDELMSRPWKHPILGDVKFTWRGWRHLTRQGRPQRQIKHSLHLLPASSHLIENPGSLKAMRRVKTIPRGAWKTEVRLLVFESKNIPLASRASADLIIVYRETVRYPLTWNGDVTLHKNLRRSITFESMYEKVR